MASTTATSATTVPGSPTPLATKSRLLALPPELRNHLYSLVFPTGEEITVNTDEADLDLGALVHTCTLIQSEAAPIFYGENTFRIVIDSESDHSRAAYAWLDSIGAAAVHVRKLTIDIGHIWGGLTNVIRVSRERVSSTPQQYAQTAARIIVAGMQQAMKAGFDIRAVEIRRAYGVKSWASAYERSATGVLVDFCEEMRYAKRSEKLATRVHE